LNAEQDRRSGCGGRFSGLSSEFRDARCVNEGGGGKSLRKEIVNASFVRERKSGSASEGRIENRLSCRRLALRPWLRGGFIPGNGPRTRAQPCDFPCIAPARAQPAIIVRTRPSLADGFVSYLNGDVSLAIPLARRTRIAKRRIERSPIRLERFR